MCTEWCKPVHWAIVIHSFRKLRCCLHSVLISSWSQLVCVLCRLEAALQIISLQSDLQTLAQLEQKHKPPRAGPRMELGFRLSHVLSVSFYILHCRTVGDLGHGAGFVSGSVTTATQYLSGASSVFVVETF